MAVIAATLKKHWSGSSGTFNLNTGAQYLAVWRLETDDADDQAQVVYSYFIASVLPFGAGYVYGNDVGAAILKDLVCDRISGSAYAWEIKVTFGPADEDDTEQQDEEGTRSEDPLDWRPRFASGTRLYREPVTDAIYRGGYRDVFEDTYPVNSVLPPMNSAFQPFTNPPLEHDASTEWIMLGTNVAEIDATDSLYGKINCVNTEAVEWDHRNIRLKVNAWELKIRDIKIQPKTFLSVDYVEVDFFLDISPVTLSSIGWRSSLLDKGTLMRACDGDPDGRGAIIAALGQGSPFPADTPRLRVPTDHHGEIIGTEFLMDGAGQELDTCGGDAAVYGDWTHYPERAFNRIDILKDLIK